MNNEKIGRFIALSRKSQNMTQRELAEKLSITDKAVSKWERGLSCPDISLLSSLSQILNVTVNELLNGEKQLSESHEIEESVNNAVNYAKENVKEHSKKLQNICFLTFTVLMFIGIVVTFICNIAAVGKLTWSLYPIVSIVFAWLFTFPIILFGKRGITASLIILSVLIIPFLLLIGFLLSANAQFMQICTAMSVIAIVYLWIIFVVDKRLKNRKFAAIGISVALVIPVSFLINFVLSKMLNVSIIDVWDILSYAVLFAATVVLLILDSKMKKRQTQTTAKDVTISN